jgi:molecular chaperone DnaK
MGRLYDDPHVKGVQKRYKYRVVKPDDGDDARVMLGDKMLTPTEVSAMILRRLKEDAEKRLGEEVTHAVITVPAYFSMNQRQATRTAGEMAGFRVKTIINEPTAAAMAFGVDLDPGMMRNVLVYDLGGGTFDISILFISGEMFDQMGIEGDMWLGGDDFDHAVMDHVMREVKKEYGVDPSGDGRFMTLLKKASEKAKIQLSELLSASIVLEAAVPLSDGGRGDVDVELTRRQFEDLPISEEAVSFGGVDTVELRRWCEDLKINGTYTDSSVAFGPDTVRNRIRKTLLLTRKAMKEAGVTKDQIDHVLLVGGSTTIPLVQRMLEEEFGPEKIMRNIDPMSCVAHGAGIAAERIPGIVCQKEAEKGADGKERLCLESNSPDATVCRRCGAPLVAQKFCPTCNYSNTMDAKRCANPAGCSHEFRRIDAGNVTAMPVGILTEGDAYEVIIPRGTSYPTFEPIVQTFRTRSNQSGISIPFIHADINDFNPEDPNQWVGAAEINFEGAHLPAGTKVDVRFSIDRDGCMDVEAIIQDGSGRRQRVFIDPKLGVNMGQKEGGEGDVEAFENNTRDGERSPGVGEPEDAGDWESFLQWSIVWAEIALRKYDWLRSDLGKTQALRERISEAREALARKDRTMGCRLEKEIIKILRAGSKGV